MVLQVKLSIHVHITDLTTQCMLIMCAINTSVLQTMVFYFVFINNVNDAMQCQLFHYTVFIYWFSHTLYDILTYFPVFRSMNVIGCRSINVTLDYYIEI